MQLDNLFDALKLEHLAGRCDALLEQAAKKDLGYREVLTQALQCEWQDRRQKGTESRLSQARLPWLKTLEQFDFSFQPSVDAKVVRELSTLSFVERAENVVLLGPPGVGKTHLAVAQAIKAAEAGHRTLFLMLEQLMTKLKRAHQENQLDRQLQKLTYPKVLILDEIGYLPLSREDASLFFRLVARHYEKAAIVLTSNKSFVVWGRSSAIPFWPRPSWIGCCITQPRSTSKVRAAG